MIDTNNILLYDLLSGASEVLIIDDNAKSHNVVKIPPPLPCRWESSPVLASKPRLTKSSLKRSASVPPTTIPSLNSLVSPIRRISRDSPLLSFLPQQEGDRSVKNASELVSEYLRLSTEDLCSMDDETLLSPENDDDVYSMATASLPASPQSTISITTLSSSSFELPPSLTSNVKKPVRRKSLDAVGTTVDASSWYKSWRSKNHHNCTHLVELEGWSNKESKAIASWNLWGDTCVRIVGTYWPCSTKCHLFNEKKLNVNSHFLQVQRSRKRQNTQVMLGTNLFIRSSFLFEYVMKYALSHPV